MRGAKAKKSEDKKFRLLCSDESGSRLSIVWALMVDKKEPPGNCFLRASLEVNLIKEHVRQPMTLAEINSLLIREPKILGPGVKKCLGVISYKNPENPELYRFDEPVPINT